jgi:hypothetical protein
VLILFSISISRVEMFGLDDFSILFRILLIQRQSF